MASKVTANIKQAARVLPHDFIPFRASLARILASISFGGTGFAEKANARSSNAFKESCRLFPAIITFCP
jgi:hypothetical protein